MTSPLENMIRSTVRCTLCGAAFGQCDCWTKCKCGWSFEKGTACNNPAHCGSGERTIIATAPLTPKPKRGK